MNVFIAYSRPDRDLAESLAIRIREGGHQVFFDRDRVDATEAFDTQIRLELAKVDFLVFVASPESLHSESYAGAELAQFRKRFPSPKGRLLTVLSRGGRLEDLSPYARSVSVPEPTGDPVAFYSAEALEALARLRKKRNRNRLSAAMVVLLGLVGASSLGYLLLGRSSSTHASGPFSLLSQAGEISRIPDPRAGEGDLFRARVPIDLRGEGSAGAVLGLEFEDGDYLPLGDFDHPDFSLEGAPGEMRTFVATFRILEVPTARNLGLLSVPALRWRIYAVGQDGETVLATSDWYEWDPNAPSTSASAQVTPFPDDSFALFETACAIPEGGFAAALRQPVSVALLSDAGALTEIRVSVDAARITCIAATENTIFVGTAAPAKVIALDAQDLRLRWEESVPELTLEHEWGQSELAIEPSAIGWADDAVWVATAGGSDSPGILLRWDDGRWEALENYDDFVIDPNDMLLRNLGDGLWSIQTNASPGGIAFMRSSGPIPFGGHDHELAAELSDLTPDVPGSKEGNFLACGSEGSVMRLRRNGERLERVALVMLGLELSNPIETWTESRMAVLGGQALVATTAGTVSSSTPLWTSLRLSSGEGLEADRLFQRNNAGIRSVSAGHKSAVMILDLGKGRTEAYRVTQTQ